MFERFTDRARKVMALANGEAQRFNHEYIGTEHVLLGLIKEGGGVGANVLKNLDLDLRKVRLEVEKLVKSGPDMVTLGKLPQTPRTRKVIEYAIEEARNLNHNYVGTEHLLLGLMRERDGVAACVLMNLGLNLEETREEVLNLLGAEVESPVVPPSQAEIINNIALLLIQKDEAIKNAEYDIAAQLRDKAEELRKSIESPAVDQAIKDAQKAYNNVNTYKWAIHVENPVDTADDEDGTINFSYILARIDIAEAGIRELLASVASTGDISVIEHLTRMILNMIDLRKYYDRLMSEST